MTNFIRIGIGILTAGLLSGCLFLDGAFHDDGLREFQFGKSENPHLQRSVGGHVNRNEGTIVIELPGSVDRTSLIPSFETEALRVTCDGKAVESAQTALDFQTPRTFHVEAADGTSRDWVVTVSLREPQLDQMTFIPTSPGESSIQIGQYETVPSSFVVSVPHRWASQVIRVTSNFYWINSPPSVRLDNEEQPIVLNPSYYQYAVFELVSFSSQVPHTLSFPRGDGTRVSYTFTFELAPLAFSAFQVRKSDNPELKADLATNLDATNKKVDIRLPFLTDATALKPRFTHTGLKVHNGAGEVISGTTALDLSASSTLTIEGAEGTSDTWTLEVTRDLPSSAKELKEIRFYRATSSPVQSAPTWSYQIAGIDLDPTENGIDWDPSYSQYFSRKAIYVEVVTTGVTVSVPGKTLSQGHLSDYPAVYDPANWLDFTTPVELTIHAEDDSTRVLTITMEAP